MKSLTYALLCLAALIGSALVYLHLPKGGLELRAFSSVSDAEFAVMRQEAQSLVAEDVALGAGRFAAKYFVLTCRGEHVLLVDNSSSQLLIVGPLTRELGTPCTQPLLRRWSSRLLPDDQRTATRFHALP